MTTDTPGRRPGPGPASVPGPAGPLLTVVDMQRVFGEPSSPWYTPGFDAILEPVGRLVAAYGERVAFTRFLVPARPEGSWTAYYELWPFAREADAAPLLDLVAPFAGGRHHLVEKPTFSKWGPELRALAGESRTLVLCGVATDCCVIATAIAASDAGMYVRVVADACRGIDDAAHERALALMAGFAPQIEVTTVARELAPAREGADRSGVGGL
jgi:nicotinamidase-related amidase